MYRLKTVVDVRGRLSDAATGGRGMLRALHDVQLRLPRGEIVGIVSESG
jgi:ABC-type glutathione transport system ATPase component